MNGLAKNRVPAVGLLSGAVLLAVSVSAVAVEEAPNGGRPRLLVLTDIGGDPDDQQSMVRLMTYANEFEIEGLIASGSGTPGELKRKMVQPELIRQIVGAYGRVRDNLARHAPGYPAAEDLLSRITSGNPNRGLEAIGPQQDTEASAWIIHLVDKPDPQPVNIAIWGGQTDLAQSLWRVRNDRGEAGVKEFAKRLRVYDIGDQDGIQDWIFKNFPDLFYVLAKAPKGADRREGTYRGMYLGGDESLTSHAWLELHLAGDHGPLGSLYPTKTWTAPNPNSAMKEGDTPSWFFFLPNGLGDPAHPEWGGWGGRFRRVERGLYRDAEDTVGKTTSARAAVYRWRPAFQNDFQTRMDWCVRSLREANHVPSAVLNGDTSRRVLHIRAKSGAAVRLSAEGSSDRDGNRLSYRWWVYPEAGTCRESARLEASNQAVATVHVRQGSADTTIHVILVVTDDGIPPLTSYRRVIVEVE